MKKSTELSQALDELHRLTGIGMELHADSEEDLDLAIRQIRALCKAYREKYNNNYFLLNLMTASTPDYDINEQAMRLHLHPDKARVLFLLESKNALDETVTEILRHLFPLQRKIYLVPVTDRQLAVLYPWDKGTDFSEVHHLACTIVDTLGSEALVRVQLAYSDIIQNLSELSGAYQQAALALKVGKLFYTEQNIFPFNRLGTGRLIYQLPETLCEDFLLEVIGDTAPDQFPPDTLSAIDRFFQNNLNIAETARQLHMHRNTLIYRLEQIEKKTGLDLRQFEDAMTFKIAIMIMNYLHSERTL